MVFIFIAVLFVSCVAREHVQASSAPLLVMQATKDDYQACLDLIIANRLAYYHPLITALNEEKGTSIPLFIKEDLALPEVQEKLLPFNKKGVEVIIAREIINGPIVGLVMLEEQQRKDGNVVFMSRLNVVDGSRSKGYRQQLFAAILDFCDRHPEAIAIESRIFINNERVLQMSQHFGFKKIRTSDCGAYADMRLSITDLRAQLALLTE